MTGWRTSQLGPDVKSELDTYHYSLQVPRRPDGLHGCETKVLPNVGRGMECSSYLLEYSPLMH